MSGLQEVLPARIRSRVYVAYAVVGFVIGAAQVGFAAAEAGQPVALTVALAVYAFAGTALGFVAQANTPSKDSKSA